MADGFKWTQQIWRRDDLTPVEKLVALAIAFHGDGCYPRRSRLAEMTGLSERTITRTIAAIDGRVVRVQTGTGRSNKSFYQFIENGTECHPLGGEKGDTLSNKTGHSVQEKVTETTAPYKESEPYIEPSIEPKAAAAAADEIDPVQRRIWKDGVELLTAAGTSETNARSILGKWARDYDRKTLAAAIASTQAYNPPDPKSYIGGILRSTGPKPWQQVGKNTAKAYEPPIDDICPKCGSECLGGQSCIDRAAKRTKNYGKSSEDENGN